MVDLRLLQTFRVLHAQGTVTAAARALNLSPSAVSQQLRQLSRQVDAELLEPDGRRLRLTASGQVLLDHANVLCAQWEKARTDLAGHQENRPQVLRLGGFATSIGSLLAPVAHSLLHSEPATQVRITEADTNECFEQILASHLDIAVLTPLTDGPAVDDPRFDQQLLLDDFVDLVVPADHPFAVQDHADLSATATEDWISPHHDQGRLIQALCATAGFTPRMVHHADDWHAVLTLISHGLGICLVPRLVPLATHPYAVRLPISGTQATFRRVLICVRRGSGHQRAIALGIQALRDRAAAVALLPRPPRPSTALE